MGFHIGPKVISATGGSIHRVGNNRIHHFPPQHVTDGLIMFLDPGDPRSFVDQYNTSKLWKDLSGNGNDATFTSAIGSLDARNGGTIRGGSGSTNYQARVPIANIAGQITNQVTSEFWAQQSQPSTGAYRVPMMATQTGSWNNGFGWWIASGTISFYVNDYDGNNGITQRNNAAAGTRISESTYLPNNTWAHFLGTYDGIRTRIYVNGVLRAAIDGNGTDQSALETRRADYIEFGTTDYFDIFNANGGYHTQRSNNITTNFKLGPVRLYNRALSEDEITQNYNAEKIRFYPYTENFTPTCTGAGGKVEVLAVAGGGGGAHGIDNGNGTGGGGAGGLIHNKSFSVTTGTAVAVAIGAGGTGGPGTVEGYGTNIGDSLPALNGGNTTFGTLTAIGGGKGGTGGGGGAINPGATGGSGGGGGNSPGGATVGQGHTGGLFHSANGYYRGGGGGGAGGPGGMGINSANGGIGLEIDISGEKKFYAGGGGGAGHSGYSTQAGAKGGVGGSGVGGDGADGDGNGSLADFGNNAVPDTGSGGGAATWPGTGNVEMQGGSGSNGTVIVRYPAEDYDAEVLIVAGGGSGGTGSQYGYSGGGGGGGGLIFFSAMRIESGKNYPIQVGKGGGGQAGGTGNYDGASGRVGYNGRNSSFNGHVAVGGGAGGGGLSVDSTSGGSGGGSGGRTSGSANRLGRGILGQGHDGGHSDDHGDVVTYGAGGGGAGSAGTEGDNSVRGVGGDGLEYSISGSTVEYSTGGDGGSAGGSDHDTPGSGSVGAVMNGGSGVAAQDGIVIIAYKGPQRGTGGTVSTTARSGYTTHTFAAGSFLFIG